MIFLVYIYVAWVIVMNMTFVNGIATMFSTATFLLFILIHIVSIKHDPFINISGTPLIALLLNPYSAYFYSFQQSQLSASHGKPLVDN